MPTLLHRLLYISLFGLTFLACRPESTTAHLPDEVDFNFHIRPILSNHCFTCHGPDESSRQAGLRLDTYEGATALLKSGKQAIVPGHWKSSEAVRRIGSDDPEIVMPPPDANNPVSERDLALLKQWIRQGAEWKDYWAFLPPDTADYDPTADIDDFIDRHLAMQGLEAGPEAEKRQLIRRLSYLLTGLPPTPGQIEAYLSNDAPDAYEQLVDRLLASPNFGERWARHWMDLVRYAETRGHEFDYPVIGAWRYRDYLIRAFNQDVPYDQLIKEHLAGDLLASPRFDPETGGNESLLGTVFYTLGEGKHSPVDIRKEEADRIDNMIDVTTKTFQGLTLACARCHDHKFDPLPTADYYALYGIFESARFTYYPTNSGLLEQARIDSIQQHKRAIRQLIAEAVPIDRGPQVLATSQQLSDHESPIQTKELKLLADFRQGDDQGWMIEGTAFGDGNAVGEPIFNADGSAVTGYATAKTSSRFGGEGLQGTLRSPTFTIDHDYLTVRAAGKNSTVRLIIDNFQLIQYPIHGGLTHELDNPEMTNIRMDVHMWRGSKAYLELLNGKMWKHRRRHDYSIEPDAWLEAEYAYMHDSVEVNTPPKPSLKEMPLRRTALEQWIKGEHDPATIAALNQQLPQFRGNQSKKQLIQHHRAIQALREKLYAFEAFGGVSEGDAVFSPVFIRGNHLEVSEERLPHRYLTVFAGQYPPFSDEGSGRLALANAIADPRNPLTARVMVNRLWHHLFGRGLVETVDNFGLQGKIPSHPALLDHLALRFIDHQWSIKAMIREIVLSRTFRRTTEASAESERLDPQNIWLQHFPIRRLEAEAIRDGILAVSGHLDSTRFGPPVPVHLTPFMQGRGRPGASGPLDGAGRRSVYQAVRRNFLPPMMLTFDFPVPFSTFGNRNVSNVPAQSLNLMNDPFVREQAEVWANHILAEPKTFPEQITQIYREAFARPPSEEEMEKARQFFADQRKLYRTVKVATTSAEATHTADKADQTSDTPSKETSVPATGEDLEKMIWADFCQVIYNSKEFIFLL